MALPLSLKLFKNSIILGGSDGTLVFINPNDGLLFLIQGKAKRNWRNWSIPFAVFWYLEIYSKNYKLYSLYRP